MIEKHSLIHPYFVKENIEITKKGYNQTVRIQKADEEDCAQCYVKMRCTKGTSANVQFFHYTSFDMRHASALPNNNKFFS